MFVVVSLLLLLLVCAFEKLQYRVLTAHGRITFDHWMANSTHAGKQSQDTFDMTGATIQNVFTICFFPRFPSSWFLHATLTKTGSLTRDPPPNRPHAVIQVGKIYDFNKLSVLPVTVANEVLSGSTTKNTYNNPGGDCYWEGGQPKVLWHSCGSNFLDPQMPTMISRQAIAICIISLVPIGAPGNLLQLFLLFTPAIRKQVL